ncbi:NupC/NupG family nucleoside CNT transporter [Gluconobacter sp. R71646]|uniref:NupC/NupG family nucleoside CNT transporter n=2 Tax=Gluconobacter TaxID=441 RepID=A0ABR9YLF2_9PROT|nr:NupC/NupG family nucleoside CNT transporter [Gluconobacter sp. R71656]MBF0866942.1 NupC/NupG family nucleoside CNT transporter [Gluconobacter sp. R75628]MBF0873181.1 NupC/NupG family nucleoside CNT transporter [Gluconobacter sp. R75629]MBF0882618.1 NupC/NupG family nucleoside CNT transporter [Gluconobacter potus]
MILRVLVGMAGLLFLGALLSTNRRAIDWSLVGRALLLQMLIAAVVLWVPAGAHGLHLMSDAVTKVLSYGDVGSAFLFGGLVGPKMNGLFGNDSFVFALKVLPEIVYVAALLGLLQHWGVLQFLSKLIGGALSRVLGTTGLESFSAVLTIFLGQSEMPIALQTCLAEMSEGELATVLCSGTSSIAGSVLAGYASLGVPMENLLAASFMAIPGGLLFSRILFPGPRRSDAQIAGADHGHHSMFEAIADGAMNGAKIAVAVGSVLIAFVGLIALANGLLGAVGLSLARILGTVFAPFAWLLGVPWSECIVAGGLLGQKIAFNEFVAYVNLSPLIHAHALSQRTITILSFALCGFANISTIGILIGAFGSAEPRRRTDVASLAVRAVAAGTLSNAMSAVIAGLFV